jgi:glutathione S-transferase
MDRTSEITVEGRGAEPEHSKRNISGNTGGLVALPVLWHFTVSHFNEKVRWALDFKRVPHVRRALLPGFHFRKIWKMTGQTAVPVLVLDGRPIHDSTRIIAALERAYPAPPLYPHNERERRRALELEDFFDKELGPSVRVMLVHAQFVQNPDLTAALFTVGMGRGSRRTLRILSPVVRPLYRFRYKIDAASAEVAREKTMAALDRIERELQPSGYLVGDGFSVADLTAAALLYPFVQPPEFPYPWPRPLPAWLGEYRASLAGRAAFQWLEEMYRRHRGTSAEVDREEVE